MNQYVNGILALLGVVFLMLIASHLIDGRFPKQFAPFRTAMKENAHYVIIGLSLIIAAAIFACSSRYSYADSRGAVLDRWTGELVRPK